MTEVDEKSRRLTKTYKQEGSIESYLKLRRENPDSEIEVALIGGLDDLFFMEPELAKFGISPDLVASVMDANQASISELSLQLIERIIAVRRLESQGETQLSSREVVLPEKLITWLIAMMLDSMSWNGTLTMNRDLIVLIREHIGATTLQYRAGRDTHQKRQRAIWIGAQMLARGQKPSFRSIAQELEVSPSTVMRWFPENEFISEVERVSKFFDEKGEWRSLFDR